MHPEEPISATPVLLLLQVPLVVASLSVMLLPAQTVVVPDTGAAGFTVTEVVTKHPPVVV